MPAPREYSGGTPSGVTYEEGAPLPLPGPSAGSMQSADAERDQAMQELLRQQYAQQQKKLMEALERFQKATYYSSSMGGQTSDNQRLGQLSEAEIQVAQNLAPDVPPGAPKQIAFGFQPEILNPGDRQLIQREIARRQKLQKRRRR